MRKFTELVYCSLDEIVTMMNLGSAVSTADPDMSELPYVTITIKYTTLEGVKADGATRCFAWPKIELKDKSAITNTGLKNAIKETRFDFRTGGTSELKIKYNIETLVAQNNCAAISEAYTAKIYGD